MTAPGPAPTPELGPVRVEKALSLLPDLEALAPLKGLLVSLARADERTLWSSSGPYLTLGKRGVRPEELRRHLARAFHQITEHLHALYTAYVDALDAQQRAQAAEVVGALVKAGRLEEAVGREAQAEAWYAVAIRVSEALQDRRPEVESLDAVAHLELKLGRHAEGARHFQRALALAEAQFDQHGATASCEGLGDAARAQGQWSGAQAWYARGLRLAVAAADAHWTGRLEHRLGALAFERGDWAGADEHLRHAREQFEPAQSANEMARVLSTQGQLDARLGREAAALTAYREALAWAQLGPRDAGLEVSIRLHVAALHQGVGRLVEAEAELRTAEQAAIGGNLTRRLVEIYMMMGKLRADQGDETGFVFFEQAIELCRALERTPGIEARVYHEYGLFRQRLGGPADEARAYLERARALFDSLGAVAERDRVDAELQQLSA